MTLSVTVINNRKMKLFVNKSTSITVPASLFGEAEDIVKETNYATLICEALVAPRQQGFDFKEQTKRLRIIKELRGLKEGGEAKLEDADAGHLSTIITEFPWGIIDENLTEMTEYLQKLPKSKK